MTLDEMIQETAMYCNMELEKQSGEYAGESAIEAKKITTGLNQAYKKVCREKYHLTFEDRLNAGDVLTKPFFRILSVKDDSGYDIPIEIVENDIRYDYEGTVNVQYEYIPSDLKLLTDEPEIPEEKVDHRLFCYFAAYLYLSMQDDTDRSGTWLNLWDDGFENIVRNNIKQTKIQNVYGGFNA